MRSRRASRVCSSALRSRCRRKRRRTIPLDGARIAFVVEDVARVPSIRIDRVAPFNRLVSPPDGSHRLFVVDVDGAVLIVDGGKVLPISHACEGARFSPQTAYSKA